MDRDRCRGLTTLAVLAAISLMLGAAPAAMAAPAVTSSARAVPIPKNLLEPQRGSWPHTGDVAGDGAELEAHFAISGSEDAGLPNPLRRVVVYLPKGLTVHTGGFGSCKPPHSNWYQTGDHPPCPQNSYAGALSEQHTVVYIGGTDVAYPIHRGAFFTRPGGLGFWEVGVGGWLGALGQQRASLRALTGAFGYRLTEEFPHRQVMDTGPDLSTDAVTVALGAAYRRGGKLISYLTMPKICPAGGYPVKAELSFGREEAPSSWETATATSKLACSHRKASSSATSARHRPPAPTANCAHHAQRAVVRRGEIGENSYHNHLTTNVYPGAVAWVVNPGSHYVVCAVRVQLQNGSWVTPHPDPSPLPILGGPLPPTIGGSYREAGDRSARFRRLVISFARSPVPQGATCSYPLMASVQGGDSKDYQVAWHPDTPARGQYTFQVTINNPRVSICGAVVELVENFAGLNARVLQVFHPAIGLHGGLSSPMPAPQRPDEVLLVWVYGRLR